MIQQIHIDKALAYLLEEARTEDTAAQKLLCNIHTLNRQLAEQREHQGPGNAEDISFDV